MMRMSTNSRRNLLQRFEGCELRAYKCPAGVWTIGYGHTSAAGNPQVTEGMQISQTEAEEILSKDLATFENGVTKMVTVSINQNQFDALVDFAYNVGLGALQKSTLLKKVNSGDFADVPAEFMKWTKGGGKELPGLVRRRQAEISLWSQVDDDATDRTTPTPPEPSKTMLESKQGNAAIATTAIGGLSAAKEVVDQAQEASDLMGAVVSLLHNQNFLLMVALVGLGCAIWYWRKQHMDKTGQ